MLWCKDMQIVLKRVCLPLWDTLTLGEHRTSRKQRSVPFCSLGQTGSARASGSNWAYCRLAKTAA